MSNIDQNLSQEENYFMSNMSEEDYGQLHSIHLHENALAEVRRKIEQASLRPSLLECEDCGEDIPEERRIAVKGVRKCIYCQQLAERK